ncbi:bacillithiol system redox-active protein YtxJ [Halobacillus litoralis]|uniref:bacillithiol system redox-active protein YtxJ n=1 Tax=Halobacillus litoralis TaxID=45668 RepID=UPI001CD36906|nr:bacillithiol system redox-active protein YtxJ [Halobacillus litoralis]MCA0972772.1 bacillithiol system redox-active protein YtxJ [Halobacillus litoralis]
MSISVLNSQQEFEKAFEENPSFFLMKNSTTCPISAMAYDQFKNFSESVDFPCYLLHVQESRELSNHIAEQYSVRHESPQVLLFKGQEVLWHDSHGAITEKTLQQVVS